ncbi:hypothetical protein CROQUDRAFT_130077 [Cronartium quercuum f. sp. fusiforme G11]|uniref:Uncharacterized protein n=1 Tax=Cronartium quercuum f. sp. fusiforme G11 TaxID=708437 RepID=A0A9P6TGV0_9BASI|nr:hypothetical protein CROQUDRAFT_130077 [Cronartium quercuum f. sp. fusiforme G11]
MFCLRYFLPALLFFPFPTAPAYLLILILISMTIQHRPCAYCSLLLSAILVSTCSWNIASLDISPLYPKRSNSIPPFGPLRSSKSHQTTKQALFHVGVKTNDTSTKPVQTLTMADDESLALPPPTLQAYELKAVRRCWFHSNLARPFDPIINSIPVDPNSDPDQRSEDPLQSDQDEPIANAAENKPQDEQAKKPQRQLNTLFSPLWTPIRRLSSLKTSAPTETTTRTDSVTVIKPERSGSTRVVPQTYYRSSFSRTPLIYSYCLRHIINFIKSFLPSSPMIYRLLAILNQNMPRMPQLPIVRLPGFLKAGYGRLVSLRGLDLSKPVYLRWEDMVAIKFVFGTPPPVMMSTV